MGSFEQKLDMGHAAEVQWCQYLASRGNVVVPVYGATEVDDSTKAPVLFAVDGNLISPDLLSLSAQHGSSFHEIKAKSKPGWYRNCKQWEHGIDKSLIDQYEKVQEKSGVPVWLVVHENLSPPDGARECKPHEMTPADLWLLISLVDALERGQHRPTWPGGRFDPRRGREGKGGWLWPRKAMRQIQIAVPNSPANANSNSATAAVPGGGNATPCASSAS